jgi:hypothetical protein
MAIDARRRRRAIVSHFHTPSENDSTFLQIAFECGRSATPLRN